jgi:hypothetical protein
VTITGPDGRAGAPDQAVVDAAMLVLDRMGLTPADLLSAPAARPAAPTFAEYHAAAATGDDPDLDTLLLRLHTEPAGGAAPWPCARRTSTRNSA